MFRKATVLSAGLHVAVLLWAVISFSGKTFEVTPAESLPVDIINDKDFSELTKGIKEAPKPVEKPKPLVEMKAEEIKPIEELTPKIVEKKEVAPTQPKSESPQQKPDPIADKIKQEPPKEQAQTQTPTPPKKPPLPPKPQPKFDASKIAALLDKRDPQRMAAAGAEINTVPGLGVSTGTALMLSASELDALKQRLMALWNPPIGAQNAQQYQVTIRIRFKRDGTLSGGPLVLTSGSGPQYEAMRDSAVRAVFVGQPYTMLRPDHYDIWKEIDFTFDTTQMFHDIPMR